MTDVSEEVDAPEIVRDGDVTWKDGEGGDEISDLLGFDLSSDDGVDRSGLRALINSVLVSSRRMPMLDVIFDRAARQMSTSLRHTTNDNVEITLDDTSATRFGEFLTMVTPPSVIGVLRSEELDNYCLLALDAEFVFSIVDLLLGGRRGHGVLTIEDRSFTQIELALVERILKSMAKDLSTAYSAVADVSFTLERIETKPRFAAIAQDASVSILAKFRVDMDDRSGRVAILTPHATLEPIMKLLLRDFMVESPGGEKIWRDHLESEITSAKIDLKAVIAERAMLLGDLAQLAPGQTVSFPAAEASRAEIRSGGLTVGSGKVGRSGTAIAIRLDGQIIKKHDESVCSLAEEEAA